MKKEEKDLLLAEEQVMCRLEEHQVSPFIDFEEAVERLERRRLRELSGEELIDRMTEQREIVVKSNLFYTCTDKTYLGYFDRNLECIVFSYKRD